MIYFITYIMHQQSHMSRLVLTTHRSDVRVSLKLCGVVITETINL